MIFLFLSMFWVSLIAIWAFRKKLGHPLRERLVRTVITLAFGLSATTLFGSGLGRGEIAFFGVSWLVALVWVWRTPIFCTHCHTVVIRSLFGSEFCSGCGKSIR
jgi:hypothetical protein